MKEIHTVGLMIGGIEVLSVPTTGKDDLHTQFWGQFLFGMYPVAALA